jgi:bacterioferritin-associated ferredoxin
MYVCVCAAVSERDILEAIDQGATTVEDVSFCTGAGKHCGTCARALASMVDECAAGGADDGRPLHLRVLTSAA